MSSDKHSTSAEDGTPRVRHRVHQRPGRPYALFVRLSEVERQLIVAAAERARLTPTGFAAKAAVAAAARAVEPGGTFVEEMQSLQRELFAARRAVTMFGVNVNQAASAVNATGQLPPWTIDAVRLCASAVERLDALTARLDRRLR